LSAKPRSNQKSAYWTWAFGGIQLLDGFAPTRANVEGRLMDMMQAAGYVEIRETSALSTMFGTLCLYQARRPPFPTDEATRHH
jgi:hypothetical protein